MAVQTENNTRRFPLPLLIVAAIALLIIMVVIGRFCSNAATIDVTVNGNQLTLHGAKTMETAIRESGIPVNPGDLISLEGHVLRRSAGFSFNAIVNGESTHDPAFQLHAGDTIVVSDGDDTVEGYTSSQEPLAHGAVLSGIGAIKKVEPGVDGVVEYRTGEQSGETVRVVIESPTDANCSFYDPDTGSDRVIALTFDEGPSDEFTAQILDILKENEARATFFCVGRNVESNPDLVRREREEGHQVCTNTYDRSWSSAVNDGNEDGNSSWLVDEVVRGRQVIADTLNDENVSKFVRLPRGEISETIVSALDEQVEAFIGWNIDTGDWTEPDADSVYNTLMQVEKGDIVLLHDGGGDRSATIEAMKRALPRLKRYGYNFVTVDELMDYPSF